MSHPRPPLSSPKPNRIFVVLSGVSRRRTRSDCENACCVDTSYVQFETSLRRDRLSSTTRAHQLPPLSALATACGLGGGTVFVLPKDSRMGGTTTGSAMPVEVEERKTGQSRETR